MKTPRGLVSHAVPWAVLAVGLATTTILYVSIGTIRDQRNREAFQTAAARMGVELDDAIGEQVALLQATAGALEAKPDLSRAEFRNVYRHVLAGYGVRVPATLGVSLVEPWATRDRLAVEAARRGVEGFLPQPPGRRDEIHAVLLVEPLQGRNLRAPGYDMHTDPLRRAAMDAARDGGRAVLTPVTTLKLDADHPVPAFLLYLPLYRGQPTDPASRRAALRGFVYAGLRASELFRVAGKRLAQEKVALRLDSGESPVLEFGTADPAAEPLVRRIAPAAGGDIVARLYPEMDFGTPGLIQPLVPPVGGAVSLLLFALAAVLRRAQAGSERRGAEVWLLAEIGRLTSGTEDDDAVLADIAKVTSGTLNAVCRIDLLGEDGRLHTVNTRTEAIPALDALERDYPRWKNDLLLRRVFDTGETQRADNYPAIDEGHAARLAAFGVGPVAIVPLRVRGRVLGAITLTRPKGSATLADDAVALVESVAGRIALAVDNARLYRAVQREKEELEHRVKERTRDLEASNQELESFCYSVSHDLRSPLRSLDGFSRVIEEDYGDRLDEPGLDYIARIRAAARRMDELITALLSLSRLTRRDLALARVDAGAMAAETMREIDPGGRADFSVEEDLVLQADPQLLKVVLENLLGNAVKFTSRVERPRVEVGSAGPGAFYVRDNGAGFDPQYAGKLFKPFERLHTPREFPGHGIGLATVERIVRRHGGEVRAESRPGEGATFFVCLPE